MKNNISIIFKFLLLVYIPIGTALISRADKINNFSDVSNLVVGDKSTIDIYPSQALSSAYPKISVSHYENNAGALNTKEYIIRYYLSNDSVLDTASDFFIDTAFVPTQSPSSSVFILKELYLSELKLQKGKYHIFIVSDFNNTIDEYNENNNIISTSFEIYGDDADLLIKNISYKTPEYTPGASIEARVNVKNNGTSIAGSNYINYYLSLDKIIDSDDYRLDQSVVSQINPGDTSYTISGFNLPQVDSGNYFLIAKIDGSNVVTESNEDNNISIQPIYISNFIVDLIPVPLHGDTINAEDGYISVDGYVTNLGSSISHGTGLSFYYSTDAKLDSLDKFLQMDYVGNIDPQGKHFYKLDFSTFNVEGFYIIITVDKEKQNQETNEANNTIYVYVKSKITNVDLHIKNLKIEALYKDNRVNVEYKIYNSGTRASSSFNFTYFYISKDSAYSIDDKYIGFTKDGYVLAGSYIDSKVTLNLPQPWSGQDYIIAYADGYKDIFESDENNNYAFVQIQGTDKDNPNIATSLTSPENAGEIVVAPNPAGEFINVMMNTAGALDFVTYELYDSHGSKSKSDEIAVKGGMFSIPSNDLLHGIYLLKVNYGNLSKTIRVYKE